MKFYLTIFSILILLSACSQNNTHTGETHMGNYTKVTLKEDLNSPDVTAKVEFIPPDDIDSRYTIFEFYVDDKYVGNFTDNKLEFTPEKYGDVDCYIVAGDGNESSNITYEDVLKLYIETGYIQFNSSGENGDIRRADDGEEIVLTPSNVTLGSCDMIWAYNVRVPKDGKISFDYIAEKLSDNAPNFNNNVLAIHFRLDDYSERDLLYPDEPYPQKYIDAETEKWIDSPAELSHGIYTLYVCPNFKSDKTRISVIHSSDFSTGTFTANYKSIINWPSK